MKRLWYLLMLCAMLAACGRQRMDDKEKTVEEIMLESQISHSAIVRNPISAHTPDDTVNVAKIHFVTPTHDFGEVDEGALVTHVFRFVNTGEAPLLISSARSTCGCTVPDWPRQPIAHGEEGAIEVRFNTAGKPNRQHKPITIVANTYPATTQIYLTGFVRPQDANVQ
jgi:hypothetical protein